MGSPPGALFGSLYISAVPAWLGCLVWAPLCGAHTKLVTGQSIEPAGATHWLVKVSTVARVSKWRS
jgi:hypothetical protein